MPLTKVEAIGSLNGSFDFLPLGFLGTVCIMASSHRRFSGFFALGAYLAAIWLPIAHTFVESDHVHDHDHECALHHDNGPVLTSRCDGDCTDPTHNHHWHDHSLCVICQGWRVDLASPVVASTPLIGITTHCFAARFVAAIPVARTFSPDQPRAPPHA